VLLGISAHRGLQACAACCDLGIMSSFTPYFILERGGRVGLNLLVVWSASSVGVGDVVVTVNQTEMTFPVV
jgi:hypothetical protein